MATIGRKTVPFENLEKPISDYCGGTGTMANFFKMLSKCKQDIIEQMGTDYSDETVLSLTDFISCVQSGVLCGRSDSFCFICKHYELNGSALAELWRRERGIEKSPCTLGVKSLTSVISCSKCLVAMCLIHFTVRILNDCLNYG